MITNENQEFIMVQYLIVCPLVFLAGFVDSIAGGGGLISLPAYIIAGVPTHFAIGSNKMASAMGTTISTSRYLKNRYLKGAGMIRVAVCAVAAALVGSLIGARLSLLVDDRILRNMMIVVLPIVAFYVLRSKDMGEQEGKEMLPPSRLYPAVILAAFAIGTYDGFYGPGTGTFLLLIFTGVTRMNIRTASALTKVINLTSNLAALATFLIHGTVVLPLGLAAGICSIAGNYIGSGLVVQNGLRIVRPVILVVLVILFVKILTGT